MSDMRDVFRATAQEIERTVPNPTDAAVAGIGARAAHRRRTRALLVAASVTVGVLLAGVGGVWMWDATRAAEPLTPVPSLTSSPTPVATASAEPTPAATPTPEPVAPTPEFVDGFAPVPHLAFNEVPWSEVGPGWFLVDFHEDLELGLEWQDSVDAPYTYLPRISGGRSLVSPAGDWYATPGYDVTEGLGAVAWNGEYVWVPVDARAELHGHSVNAAVLDQRHNSRVGEISTGYVGTFVAGSDRVVLNFFYGGDGVATQSLAPSGDSDRVCDGWYQDEFTDMSVYLDQSEGTIVCFDSIGDTGTRMREVSIEDGSETHLADLSRPYWTEGEGETAGQLFATYQFLGWLEGGDFLLARNGPAGIEATFRYVRATGTTDAVERPELVGADRAFVHTPTDTTVILGTTAEGNQEVQLVNGGAVTVIDTQCPFFAPYRLEGGDVIAFSGERMMLTCPDTRAVTMWDVVTGAELGVWNMGDAGQFAAFDHPDW